MPDDQYALEVMDLRAAIEAGQRTDSRLLHGRPPHKYTTPSRPTPMAC